MLNCYSSAMRNLQDDQYNQLAHAIALLIYRRCIDVGDGIAVYEHYSENRLGVPADALSRLGVMRPIGPDKWLTANTHAFSGDWNPQTELDLIRHSGEPSIFDLIVSLCLMVDWDSQYMPENLQSEAPENLALLPQIDLRDHRRFSSSIQLDFDQRVFRFATLPLINLGLGNWCSEGGFSLIFSLREGGRPIDLADTYNETRHNMAEQLGGVKKLFPMVGR